jgi:predicted MPP superfamily phosphohydrolase
MIEILHLSDLHWNSEKSADSQIVVDALVADLKQNIEKGSIRPDIVVFSGDLVQAGEHIKEFDAAFNALIAPVLDVLKLDYEDLFIVPGNHDIDRKVVRSTKFIDNGIRETLKSVDSLNTFIDGLNAGAPSNMIALDRLQPYYDFLDTVSVKPVFSTPLLRVFKKNIRGVIVGAACFDTAWRASGEADDIDRGHLLLGERNVDNAIAQLTDTDINLAIMHHPAEWLAEFDEVAVSSRISSNFDVLFCGHMHRPVPQTRTTAQGTAVLSQTGSVYAGRQWFNGYQCVQLHLAEEKCKFIVRSYYDTPRRVFDVATVVMANGEVSFPFATQKKTPDSAIVESFLRTNRQRVRENASEHLNMIGLDIVSGSDVKESFVPPPLMIRSAEINGQENPSSSESNEEISCEDLLRSDCSYLLAGEREAGKSSLLHYMAVLVAEGICDKPRIPVILNVETLKSGDYELRKAIALYFGSMPLHFNLKSAIDEGNFLFFADNFVAGGKGEGALKAQVAKNQTSRWVCVSRPRAGSITGDVEDPSPEHTMRRVRIGALPRRSIRVLSKRWCAAIGHSEDQVFDAVMKQLKADGLPRSGYMVTLILWAMKQERELNRVNEAILLSNVADYLLEKADFRQSVTGNLDPRGKEITLEYLAEFFANSGGYATVDEVVTYIASLISMKRLPLTAIDVFGELVRCGILDRNDDTASFKYRCFQEYFFALRLKGDPKLLARIMAPGSYQKYTREIEMLAGLRRQNSDLIDIITTDMGHRIPAELESITRENFNEVVGSSLGLAVSKRQLAELRRKRMSAEQVDDLLDAADRRAISRRADTNDSPNGELSPKADRDKELVLTAPVADRMSIGEYVVTTNLLARITKNSDFTDFDDKAPAARTVFETYAKILVMFKREITELLVEVGEKEPEKALSKDESDVLAYHLTKTLSQIIATVISDLLSSPNVGPMMDDIYSEKDRSTIERLFIMYLLQHLRFPGWEDRWSDMLRESGQSGFVVETVINRLRYIGNNQYQDEREYKKMHKVIDTAEEVLGWNSVQKDHMIADLRKAALVADLRDTN